MQALARMDSGELLNGRMGRNLVDDQSPAGFVFPVNVGAVKGWRRRRIGWWGQYGFLYLVDGYLIRFNPAQVCD